MLVSGHGEIAILAGSASAVSALGDDWKSTWNHLKKGTSGLASPKLILDDWPASPPVGIVSTRVLCPKYAGRLEGLLNSVMDSLRTVVDSLAAENPRARGCIVVGSSHGDPAPISLLATRRFGELAPRDALRCIDDDLYWNLTFQEPRRLPVTVVHGACASGIVATVNAAASIMSEAFDYAIVISADALSRVAFEGFQRVGAMSRTGCRPFDRSRDGMSAGEGAVAYIVFHRQRITCPGECVLFLGGSYNCDGAGGVEPSPDGLAEAIDKSLQAAGTPPSAVNFCYWHGTGTLLNDATEAAVAQRFWPSNVPIGVSLKGALGHTMGAAAAFNVLGAAQTIIDETLPPTAGLADNAFPDHPINAGTAIALRAKTGLCTAMGFGGVNAALLLGAAA